MISTSYVYARELLAEGHGVLVPWRDPQAITREVVGLLGDDTKRLALRACAAVPGQSTWSHTCTGATTLLNVTHPGGLMPISIQYAGFQVQLHGRDYSYYVLDPPSASRHFTFTIPHQAFAEKHILYQDAADLCYQKLQREILMDTGESPMQSHCIVSDQELNAYRDSHRPIQKHSW